MAAPRVFDNPWQELKDSYGDASFTSWPLTAMTPNVIHKFLILLRDVRIHGTVSGIPVDCKLSDGDEYNDPTEQSRLADFGIAAALNIDSTGTVGGSTAPFTDFILSIGYGHPNTFTTFGHPLLSNNDFVKFDGGDLFLPMAFAVDYADGRAVTHQGPPFPVSPFTLTFFGQSVTCYDTGSPGAVTGSLTVEATATNGYLTFGGLWNADTGEFTGSSF